MPWPERRSLLLAGAIIATALLAGALLFAWSGLYNIAASRGHFAVVRMFLEFGMRNSVETHSLAVQVPEDLSRDGLATLGAAHYETVCVRCHGAPGRAPSPTLGAMLPHAPELTTQVETWNDAELFWIVKHGLKYTGMPAWPYQSRDDEVWAVVAFLRRLPGLDPAAYSALASGHALPADEHASEGGASLVNAGVGGWRPRACTRCHGDARNPPVSDLVPKLAGQKTDYLAASLAEFANGSRESGMMSEIAALLTNDNIETLARYYADLGRADALAAAPTAPRTEAAAGERLAREGDRSRAVPACATCHGETGPRHWPRLAHQSRRYIEGQLRLWKAGHRRGTADGRLMGMIAERMSDDQIKSAAEYYGALPASASAGGGSP